jgi:rubrerythrin
MAKLYATLENSKGKTVSISDNEQITATVYDGNMKAYSVVIEWAVIGDPEHWMCPECGHSETWDNYKDGTPICPECDIDMEHKMAVMGAIVTTREWRNRLPTNDRKSK